MTRHNALPSIPPNDYVVASIESFADNPHASLAHLVESQKRVVSAIDMQIHDYEFSMPSEPDEDVEIGRILSPEKFVRFLRDPAIFMATPSMYEDRFEGTFPGDVLSAHVVGLKEHIRTAYRSDDQRKETLLLLVREIFASALEIEFPKGTCSCWTMLDNEATCELMWRHHANGQNGVGIKLPYGELKRIFQDRCFGAVGDNLIAGKVQYKEEYTTLHPAFRKRPSFAAEKEVRFFAPWVHDPTPLTLRPSFVHQAFETFSSQDVDQSFEMDARELLRDAHSALFAVGEFDDLDIAKSIEPFVD